MRCAVIFALVLCLVLPATAIAQENGDAPPVIYPDVVEQGVDAQAFVPKGWLLERSVEGDLNRDGMADLVIVLHDADPINLIKPEPGMETPLDTNPRMLVVTFADKAGGYRLAFANSSIIPRILYSNEF